MATGALRSDEILAVTFTDKAAGEMRARLERLGVDGRPGAHVPLGRARAAALLRAGADRQDPGVEGAAAAPHREHAAARRTASGRPRTSRPRSSGRRTGASRRPTTSRSLGDHEPPIPADLMVQVYRDYEQRKADQGSSTSRTCSSWRSGCSTTDAGALEQVRARYRAFTVDEYQDVNLLQQTLLDRWLGDRDELCAVGDDYQSIYAFTGREPGVPARDAASDSRTRPSSGSRRTTARRPRCSSSRTGSCRGSAAPRRCCGRRGLPATSR